MRARKKVKQREEEGFGISFPSIIKGPLW